MFQNCTAYLGENVNNLLIKKLPKKFPILWANSSKSQRASMSSQIDRELPNLVTKARVVLTRKFL